MDGAAEDECVNVVLVKFVKKGMVHTSAISWVKLILLMGLFIVQALHWLPIRTAKSESGCLGGAG